MTDKKLSDPPELVALCRLSEDGQQEVAGWAMVLPGRVVGYIPDSTQVGVPAYTFRSLESAEWILGYSDIYPVRDLATR